MKNCCQKSKSACCKWTNGLFDIAYRVFEAFEIVPNCYSNHHEKFEITETDGHNDPYIEKLRF